MAETLTDAFINHVVVARSQYDSCCRELAEEIVILRKAIRAHRDARGDDRCWMDDEELYKSLPEGYTPPERDSTVELERCRQYIASRQHPQTVYLSPEREIERLKRLLIDHGIRG